MDKLYDALIIGGGPAGLSTALGLGRVHRSCIVFSDAKFRNDGIEASHSVLSRDHVHPEEIRRIGMEQIERYGNTEYAKTRITKVSKASFGQYEGFIVEDDSGKKWHGRTVVLAMGVKDILPDIRGYAENWPENIYQCLFCDGHERADLPKGVLCTTETLAMSEALAGMAHSLSSRPGSSRLPEPSKPPKSDVTIFTNGPLPLNPEEATTTTLNRIKAFGITIDTRPIDRLVAGTPASSPCKGVGLTVHLTNPSGPTSEVHLGFLVEKPSTIPVGQSLITQLGLETVTQGLATYIKSTPPFNTTSSPGIFVAGDAGTQLTQVTGAMSSGIFTAAGATHKCIKAETALALNTLKSRDGEGLEKGIYDADIRGYSQSTLVGICCRV